LEYGGSEDVKDNRALCRHAKVFEVLFGLGCHPPLLQLLQLQAALAKKEASAHLTAGNHVMTGGQAIAQGVQCGLSLAGGFRRRFRRYEGRVGVRWFRGVSLGADWGRLT
jgi:hypothetical protein